jgi:hypothetical protein
LQACEADAVVFDFLQVLKCRSCSFRAGAGMFLMVRHVFLVVCFGMVNFCAGLLVSSERLIPACSISGMRVTAVVFDFLRMLQCRFAVLGLELELVCF